ncbi:hypothetical protein NLG97_g9518 [Lecanicillium saksenae]|uniref:Uncharacterized protein n=1 Tax=Lecanicillium saksenae TaxID=468837 RepID=A0ACC1QHT2_9HYPO|nr:hypothetical protein NLG97_g9518 [Lecanicillium saksenae]
MGRGAYDTTGTPKPSRVTGPVDSRRAHPPTAEAPPAKSLQMRDRVFRAGGVEAVTLAAWSGGGMYYGYTFRYDIIRFCLRITFGTRFARWHLVLSWKR